MVVVTRVCVCVCGGLQEEYVGGARCQEGQKRSEERRGKSVTVKNTGSVFALIILHLKAAHFQIFRTSYFYTVEIDRRGGGFETARK